MAFAAMQVSEAQATARAHADARESLAAELEAAHADLASFQEAAKAREAELAAAAMERAAASAALNDAAEEQASLAALVAESNAREADAEGRLQVC